MHVKLIITDKQQDCKRVKCPPFLNSTNSAQWLVLAMYCKCNRSYSWPADLVCLNRSLGSMWGKMSRVCLSHTRAGSQTLRKWKHLCSFFVFNWIACDLPPGKTLKCMKIIVSFLWEENYNIFCIDSQLPKLFIYFLPLCVYTIDQL